MYLVCGFEPLFQRKQALHKAVPSNTSRFTPLLHAGRPKCHSLVRLPVYPWFLDGRPLAAELAALTKRASCATRFFYKGSRRICGAAAAAWYVLLEMSVSQYRRSCCHKRWKYDEITSEVVVISSGPAVTLWMIDLSKTLVIWQLMSVCVCVCVFDLNCGHLLPQSRLCFL